MTAINKNLSNNCQDCKSFSISVFCSLHNEGLETLNQQKITHHYKSGDVLFHSGDTANGLYCVVSGTVKLEREDSQGKTQMVQVYKNGDMIGYRSLFSDETTLTSAVAVEPTEICFIPKKAVFSLVKDNPDLSLKFLTRLSNDFRMMEIRLQRANHQPATERIAESLLFLRENFESKKWTRKEIADWAGTTTETVIRTLADFEAEGLIEQKGRGIVITNRLKLLEKASISI